MVRLKGNKEKGLPEGWVWVKLMDVCDQIVGGGTPSTKIVKYWKGSIPWISSADIQGIKKIIPRRQISNEAVKNSTANILPKGGIIVVTRVGLGKIAIAPYEICFSQDSQGLILNKKLVSESYALLYLSKAVGKFKHEGRGTTIKGVTKKQLAELDIPLPPLTQQLEITNKIEELFSELDKTVEELKIAQQQLKVYRQAVLKWAFEGRLTNDIVMNGQLPKGWKKSTIGNIFEVFIGSTPSRKNLSYWNGDINWISSGEVAFRNIIHTKEKISQQGIESSSCKVHPPGTVIMAMIGEGKTRGQTAILKVHAAHNQNTAAIRVPSNQNSELLYYYLVLKYEENRMIGSGNNQKALNKERVKSIPFPSIPQEEQKRIVQEIEIRLSVSDKFEQTINDSIKKTEILRQGILKKAFEGGLNG